MKLRLTIAVLMLIAAIRVALTWTTFSHTADEPAHVAAGMEILTQHRYTIQIENTPLTRIVLTVIPWLSDSEYRPTGHITDQGNSVIYSRGEYRANLVRIRAGNLVFLFIAMLFTWLWARAAIGDVGAIIALFLFSTQPAILGHAGLATTDMAATAGMAVALYAWSKWLASPSLVRALTAGAAAGFAINCKLSALVFVPAAWGAMLAARAVERKRMPWEAVVPLAIAIVASLVIVWAGYGFRVGTMSSIEPVLASEVPPWLASTPVPAPQLFRGFVKLIQTDRRGHPAYLFGMSSLRGWWWYFPVALALKSTLATLLGVVAALVTRLRHVVEPAAAVMAILAVAMASHIDVGVRYVLPIFVPLSIMAAAGALALSPRRKWFAAVLMAWQALSGLTHPDYLAYFNELAVREPSRYLLDSNLDWGQDLLRLEEELKKRNVHEFGFKYFGPADLKRHDLPRWNEIRIDRPQRGWVAISEMFYNGVWYDGYHPGRYPWLVNRTPVARVGKSIRLYFIP